MPFALPSTFSWFKHRLLAAKRVLYKLKSTHFIDLYKSPNVTVLQDSFGISLCPICGFCMAELLLEEGWIARVCSAIASTDIIDNPCFKSWQTKLVLSQPNNNARINDNLSMLPK